MKFFKNNFDNILKLFINQIGITIFTMFIYTAAGFMFDTDEGLSLNKLLVNILISVFSIVFYFVLIYTAAWDMGAKDKIRIDAGRLEAEKLKGFKMGAIAYIPNFFIGFICAFTFIMYFIGAGEGFYTVSAVFNTFVRFGCSMYLGVLQGIFYWSYENTDLFYLLQAIGFVILPFSAAGISHFGYSFGAKDKRIFNVAPKTANKK